MQQADIYVERGGGGGGGEQVSLVMHQADIYM